MFRGKSKEDILKTWLRAADEFTQTGHVGKFAIITGQTLFHLDHQEELWLATHVVEEIAGARAATNPDKVDAVLLRSRTLTSQLAVSSEDLLEECVRTNIIAAEDSKPRANAVSESIRRRRTAIGCKGRGYYFG